jgi:transcriptional regulator with GAF, ATPase, and Fis domain
VLDLGLKELATATQADVVYAAVLEDGQKLVARKLNGDASEAVTPVDGDSVVEQLRETLTPITLTNAAQRATWLGQVKSALVLPLAVRGKLIGVAAVASTGDRSWSAGDVDLANALAGEMAVALHNARLHERTLKRLVDLGAISQSTRAVSGSVELSKLYDAVRTQVGSLVGAKTMSLALYDEARNQVSFPLLVQNGRTQDAAPVAPNPVLWHIIQTQQSLRWPGEDEARAKELGIIHSGNGGSKGKNGATASNGAYGKSYMGVPLVVGKKTIGVLSYR